MRLNSWGRSWGLCPQLADVTMTVRNVFFHVHVRKCGGSTFYGQILSPLFESSFFRDRSLIDDRYTRDQVSEILENCPWLRAYSSHKISLDLPYDSKLARPIAIAFVRDPIERFYSHYRYVSQHHRSWDEDAQQKSLEEYTAQVIEQDLLQSQRQFSQLEQLCGKRGGSGLEDLNTYLQSEQVYLFPSERFDEACLLLESLFPDEFSDGTYPHRVNQTRPIETLSPESQLQLQQAIEPEEFELNRLAHHLLDEAMARTFRTQEDQEHELTRFRKRCLNSARPGLWHRLTTAFNREST